MQTARHNLYICDPIGHLVHTARYHLTRVTCSLSDPVRDRSQNGESMELADTLIMRDPSPDPLRAIIEREESVQRERRDRERLVSVLAKLNQLEREVTLGVCAGKTYAQLGRNLEMSREGVRQVHLRALRILGIPIEERPGTEPERRRCPYCNTEFTPLDKAQRYCSTTCCSNMIGSTIPPRECKVCGEMFKPPVAHSVYCSYKCQRHVSAARRREAYFRKRSTAPPSEIVCRECGVTFVRRSSHNFYCSKECKLTNRARRARKERHG